MRFYKSIGLGFKIPKEAIEGSYVDKKCPFTGNVSIRGRILKVNKNVILCITIYYYF
jgi:small subunit ribosomal protein S11e